MGDWRGSEAREGAFFKAMRRPREVQRDILLRMLSRNRETAFGRQHGFAAITDERDYRHAVPIRDDAAYLEWFARAARGEKNVLTRSRPHYFAITSGTTGRPKLVPYTPEAEKACGSLAQIWFKGLLRDHPHCMEEGFLTLVGAEVEGHTAGGLPYGSLSGRMAARLPDEIKRRSVLPQDLAAWNQEQRDFIIARLAMERNLGHILAPNPSSLIRLAETIRARREELIRAIHDGVAGGPLGQQRQPSDDWPQRLEPRPARAAYLGRLAQKDGDFLPSRWWPELAVIGCWLGGSLSFQIPRLRQLYGAGPALRDLGYLSSEAHVTVPLVDGSPAGILALSANFCEFIPEDELENNAPTVLGAWELENGRRYGILLTTPGGLYRYDIADIVEVRGYEASAPLLAFVRKARNMTSLTGEKLHPNHFVAALERLHEERGWAVREFRAYPEAANMRYVVMVEADDSQAPAQGNWAQELDRHLGAVNIEYRRKRESGRLREPLLLRMSRGWGEERRRAAFETGRREAQYKWQVLVPDADPADSPYILPPDPGASDTH